MRTIDLLLEEYGESHQNPTNKWIHWICVPTIMFRLLGLLWTVTLYGPLTLGMVFLGAASLYYLRLSGTLFVGMLLLSLGMAWGIMALEQVAGSSAWQIHVGLFAAAWVGQFVGQKIECKKPSFLKDLKFILVGPAWLLLFVYRKVGLPI
ncbi:MAG: DUF962 domain-containing protein [Bacteroidota bacterium]